ncbi:RNA helicase [Pueribacillus theae]|uniref:RNA helicase n=2 Tax=Pueribacillus theae TaxID=2171751 RepID=A0A2U1JVD1_9BACI|nr:RNA helicase [Pueribacillus theae]
MKPFLQKAWKQSGFQKPTNIQTETIPLITEGKDVIAESPTGTGKTLAYLIPLLDKIKPEKKNAQVVVVAPSRELVMQIFDVVQQWAKEGDMLSASFIGGANVKRQLEKLKKNPQIIVGTPGRVAELIKMKKLKMHQVKTIVLDEADQLLIPEHMETIQTIVKATMKERQIVMFSATLPETVEKIGQEIMNDPVFIRVKKDKETAKKVNHLYFVCDKREKIDILRSLMRGHVSSALAFFRDVGNLNVIAAKLAYKGIEAGILHSESSKREREEAIKKFRSKDYSLLLATDLAARGLDIDGLSHVIHFDLPENANQYIHRSGRTGRMGAEGTVISIVTASEERVLKKYSRDLNIPVHRKVLYGGKIRDEKPVLKKYNKTPNARSQKRTKPKR